MTAEGLGEYRYDESGALIEGKVEAGGEQSFIFAATEGPFDLQNPMQKITWAEGYLREKHQLILRQRQGPERLCCEERPNK